MLAGPQVTINRPAWISSTGGGHRSSARSPHLQRRVTPSAIAAPPKHSTPPAKAEIFRSLEGWAADNVLPLLKPVEKYMVTEDALPTYETMLNRTDGIRDETGSSPSPWAVWNRAWTAEENRHGDLLRTFLYLSGRVDMVMVERTVQYLIGAGMDPGTENDPYLGSVYTSFQERATFVSHANTARLAKEGGDPVLARICGVIAADEKRHELAYTRIVEKLLELDPNGAVLAVADMMRKRITMPAHLMYDGRDPKLFKHFAAVAQRLGVYTAEDYADILEFLIGRWGLEKLEDGLDGEGRRAQEFVCGLAQRIRRLQERADEKAKKKTEAEAVKFSWIFDREMVL
ncbi:unnamed protein product [Linum tenue]|uniref:Acyl-[acyl-carrier-protein] desaturase n=1 Tax=Linum tenue TaxID=586396 RepID=A0AAV0II54_9ROSI|nr:unnamed protein product [Linum tenue]